MGKYIVWFGGGGVMRVRLFGNKAAANVTLVVFKTSTLSYTAAGE